MAESKTIFALALNLSNSDDEPKVLLASDLFRYKSGRKCYRFKPKTTTLKDKFEEFGLLTVIGDDEKIVRHRIIELHEDVDELLKIPVEKPRRTVGFNRLSTSPTIESTSSYSFPDEDKARRKEVKTNKDNETQAIKASLDRDGDRILKQYQKITSNAGINVASTNDKTQVTGLSEAGPSQTAAAVAELSKGSNQTENFVLEESLADLTVDYHGLLPERVAKVGKMKKKDEQDKKKNNPTATETMVRKADHDRAKQIPSPNGEEEIIETVDDSEVPPQDVKEIEKIKKDEKQKDKKKKKKKVKEHVGDKQTKEIAVTCNVKEHLALQETLLLTESKVEDAYKVIARQQEEIKELEIKLEQKAEVAKQAGSESVLTEIKAMLTTNLPNLVSKETDSDSAAGFVKKTKHSKLGELPQNLLDDDDEEVQGLSKIKVSSNRYVDRTALVKIEDKATHITGRIELLVHLFYGKKAHLYSVKPKSKLSITDEEISSMEKILRHMSWNKATFVIPKKIRTRVISYTSALRCELRKKSESEDGKAKSNDNGKAHAIDRKRHALSPSHGHNLKRSKMNWKEGKEDSEDEVSVVQSKKRPAACLKDFHHRKHPKVTQKEKRSDSEKSEGEDSEESEDDSKKSSGVSTQPKMTQREEKTGSERSENEDLDKTQEKEKQTYSSSSSDSSDSGDDTSNQGSDSDSGNAD